MLDEFTELVRRKYHLLSDEEYMELGYKEKNKMLYDVLKHYKICVVPSQRIESYDRMPHFMIIETNLRDIKRMPVQRKGRRSSKENEALRASEQKSKLTRFDPRNVKGNIELF